MTINKPTFCKSRKARNKLGLTQDDLVRKSGVKHTTLTKIESNVITFIGLGVLVFVVEAIILRD